MAAGPGPGGPGGGRTVTMVRTATPARRGGRAENPPVKGFKLERPGCRTAAPISSCRCRRGPHDQCRLRLGVHESSSTAGQARSIPVNKGPARPGPIPAAPHAAAAARPLRRRSAAAAAAVGVPRRRLCSGQPGLGSGLVAPDSDVRRGGDSELDGMQDPVPTRSLPCPARTRDSMAPWPSG